MSDIFNPNEGPRFRIVEHDPEISGCCWFVDDLLGITHWGHAEDVRRANADAEHGERSRAPGDYGP